MVYKKSTKSPYKARFESFYINATMKRINFGIGTKFPAPIISDEAGIKTDSKFICINET